jgi:DNA-binding transcriptional LysR family regulator
MSQPSVSEVIANVEDTLGVKLLDRSPRGVETTLFGQAMLRRARAVFDELNQAVQDIQFLADPSVGEVRFGCPESISASLLPTVIRDFVRDHPGIRLHVYQMPTLTLDLPELRARKIDFVIARLNKSLEEDQSWEDLDVELLFNDEIVVAAGRRSRWARRRKLSLADLADAHWIQTASGSWGASLVEGMFRAAGLQQPRTSVMTLSVHLRTNLPSMGDFVTAMPKSVLDLNAERFALRALPVELPARPWPVFLVTVRNRTLNPAAALFLKKLRQHVSPTTAPQPRNTKAASTGRRKRDARTSGG